MADSPAETPDSGVTELQAEIERLKKIIRALINRAERSTEVQGSEFTLFQTAVMLDGRVRARTKELQEALRRNEEIFRALQDSEVLYRSVVAAMIEGVVLQSASGRITALNRAAEQILGEPGESITGRTWADLPWPIVRKDGSAFPAELHPANLALRTGEPQHGVVMGLCRTEQDITWIAVNAHPLPPSSDDPASQRSPTDNAVVTTFHDITANEAKKEALRKSEAKFSALFNLTPDPTALTRLRDGLIMETSRSFAEFFGLQPDEVAGRTMLQGGLDLWVDAQEHRRWVELLRRDGQAVGFETQMWGKEGAPATVLLSGKVIEIEGEEYIIGDIHDISAQKELAKHFERMASHDPLTGLPNRHLLGDRLKQAIAQCQRSGRQVAVCYVDLDGFKAVNDRFGHEAGDHLLIEIKRRLVANVRGGDTIARMGGDEFVVLIVGLLGEDQCARILHRLLVSVATPFHLKDGQPVQVSASIGVSMFPQEVADADMLVRYADRAMYDAKKNGGNQYRFFGAA